jgi:hypothetical protein
MEQILEFLLAGQEEMMARAEAKTDTNKEIMDAWKEKLKAMMEACLKKPEAKTETGHEPMEAEIKPDLEEAKAKESEVNLEEVEAVAEHQEVHTEEAVVETIEALQDQDGEWHLAVGHHRQLKKWAQSDGESWQKLATVCRQMTLHAMVIKD